MTDTTKTPGTEDDRKFDFDLIAAGKSPRTEVDREIGSKQIAAGQARTALVRASYPAAIDDVWAAWTTPNRLDRWFLPVSGDLRVGGTFQLEGNAGGEIKRCEPPRLLAVTWVYGDRPVDEVELRLSEGEDGTTTLELEHATISTQVEWEGQMVNVIPGVGSGWEVPLAYALPAYLRGELPDKPASEWFEFTPEIMQISLEIAQAWEELLKSSST
jgi:uncharacterized protein YndB with AHSA1/START domain